MKQAGYLITTKKLGSSSNQVLTFKSCLNPEPVQPSTQTLDRTLAGFEKLRFEHWFGTELWQPYP